MAAASAVISGEMCGSITATHYVLTEIRARPTRVDLWAARGRLVRLDLPQAQISVVRTDVEAK